MSPGLTRLRLVICLTAASFATAPSRAGYTLQTLATFNGANGANPHAGVTLDAAGNLYGTTENGGAYGQGSVYRIANDANHTLTTLASFHDNSGGFTGYDPQGGVTLDAEGNLYGTTHSGGAAISVGAVFKIANDANRTLTGLANFDYYTTGGYPASGVTIDGAGNLYGTTEYRGPGGHGTVFEVANDASHTLTNLVNFRFQGANPIAGVTLDGSGNLYGTTFGGGGTVYRVANDANHTLTTLASFNGVDGYDPTAGVTLDARGNLYGTTQSNGAHGGGTLYRIANDASHTLTVLVDFDLGANPHTPYAGVTIDAAGNLFGTTEFGGKYGSGAVYEVSNDAGHTLTTLASFNGLGYITGGVTLDARGNLFGTTSAVTGSGYGTVWELVTDTPTPTVVPEPSPLILATIGVIVALRCAVLRSPARLVS